MIFRDGSGTVLAENRPRTVPDNQTIHIMELKELREKLDTIDRALEASFAARMEIVAQIGEYKRGNGLPVLDAAREEQVLRMHTEAQPEEMKPYMEEFFRSVMALSRQFQEEQSRPDSVVPAAGQADHPVENE